MPHPRKIKFYKGVVLVQIHEYLNSIDDCDKDTIDERLKNFVGLSGVSCLDMSGDELQELIEMSIFWFGELTEELGERIDICEDKEIVLRKI